MQNCVRWLKTHTHKEGCIRQVVNFYFWEAGLEGFFPPLFLLLFFVFQILCNEPKLLLGQFCYISNAGKYTQSLCIGPRPLGIRAWV